MVKTQDGVPLHELDRTDSRQPIGEFHTAFSCSAGIASSRPGRVFSKARRARSVNAGRLFGGHPQGLALTGRAPCYDWQTPCRSSACPLLAAAIVRPVGPSPRLPARRPKAWLIGRACRSPASRPVDNCQGGILPSWWLVPSGRAVNFLSLPGPRHGRSTPTNGHIGIATGPGKECHELP